MEIRIAGIEPESVVDGEGIRFAVFMQGCLRNCRGCHNPATHALDGGKIVDTAEIIDAFSKNPLLTGITLTGGEPMLQIPAALELARAAKKLGQNVWCYTGYRYEELSANAAELLKNVDVLVDGEYLEEQRDLELPFRGSKNQRILYLEQGRVKLWKS